MTNRFPFGFVEDYWIDAWQRSIMYLDVLRERGNIYFEHKASAAPNVLNFEAELIRDGRTLAQPVNYLLVRIVPPEGASIDTKKPPYVVIDPRAGHGPGIGGMKHDSEIGVAMAAGHPCYFIGFLPAISNKAAKAIRQTIREWRMASTRNNQRLEDLARLTNPAVRGWMNYYGRFYRSKCIQVLRHLNEALARWAQRKFKRFKRRERASMHWLGRIARRDPNLFVLWQLGVRPEAGV